jgi:DNA-binding CsgD family transcriptional regulator
MNKTSCEVLRYARDEIMELGEEYSKTIVFDKDEYERVNVMHEEFFERNDKTEIYSNFQKLRPKGEEDYQWMYVTSKIYRWDDNGLPVERLLISMPVSLMGDVSDKVNKVLDENIYLKKNFHKFSVLTKREKEILKNIALGKSSTLIADELFISKFTVDQHRKNIKSKLALKSIADMVKFAETFDLI